MTHVAQLQHPASVSVPEKNAMTRIQLIRTIQLHANEEPCFATDARNDCAKICEWRRECPPNRQSDGSPNSRMKSHANS